jgi:hypothetical protein
METKKILTIGMLMGIIPWGIFFGDIGLIIQISGLLLVIILL